VVEQTLILQAAAFAERASPHGCDVMKLGLLLLGQLLSLLVAGTGVCSTMLASRQMSFPMLQSTITYLFLAVHLCDQTRPARRERWWKYALIAAIDLEANYLIVLAYRSTTITSVMLLDCATIPSVMLLSRLLLNAKYTRLHAIGVGICVAGLACTVASDRLCNGRDAEQEAERQNAIWGDLLTLAGATLYAVSNTFQEACVKQHGRSEFLGSIGMFGGLFGTLQTAALEGPLIAHASWAGEDLALLAAFTLCLVAFYSLTSIFMQEGDATLFTLSLLTSDAFAFAYAGFVLRQHFCGAYCVGFAVTIAGVLVFTSSQIPTFHLGRRAEGTREPLSDSAPLDAERSFLSDGVNSLPPPSASRTPMPAAQDCEDVRTAATVTGAPPRLDSLLGGSC
jgi:solute carrier family 35 protein F1/2